jgi:hypothetical protein
MSPTLHHTFKGFVKGLSYFHINPVDIRKVIKINYRKRLFCIFDTEYKYSMEIEYFNPRSEISSSTVITSGGHVGFGIYNQYVETSEMTLRYKTEKEVIDEIDEIKKIQKLISQFDIEQNLKLEKFINKRK